MNYIIYDETGKILRMVNCPSSLKYFQAGDGEFVMEGVADDTTQKIIDVGIKGKIVDKTPAEIEADNPTPPEIPFEERTARITNEQLQNVMKRLDNLEKKQ